MRAAKQRGWTGMCMGGECKRTVGLLFGSLWLNIPTHNPCGSFGKPFKHQQKGHPQKRTPCSIYQQLNPRVLLLHAISFPALGSDTRTGLVLEEAETKKAQGCFFFFGSQDCWTGSSCFEGTHFFAVVLKPKGTPSHGCCWETFVFTFSLVV